MNMAKPNTKEGVALTFGILLLLAGVLANPWTAARRLSPDGTLSATNMILIGVLDLFLIALGARVIHVRRTIAPRLNWPRASHVLLFACVTLAGFVVLEGALRFWFRHFASEQVFGTYATYSMMQEKKLRYTRHPYLGYCPTPNYRNPDGDRHNALGFRGEEIALPKPAHRFRIVALGGSTTYGVGLPTYREAYPYQLERELHERGADSVEVVNAGAGDYDTWPTLINLLFRVLDLRPDMILFYEGTNEVETRMVYPFEAYRPDNSGRIAPPIVPNTRLIEHFLCTRILFYPLGLVRSYGDLHRLNAAPTYVGDMYYDQLLAKVYPSGVFRRHPAPEILAHNQPRYTERNIRSMIAIAREFGVTPVLVSFAYSPMTVKTSSEVYQKGIAEYNDLIKELAAKAGVPFFDFAPRVPRDRTYWTPDGVHLSAEGSRLQARLISEFLLPLLKR
jgi:lysophospholipase L1-like esterase